MFDDLSAGDANADVAALNTWMASLTASSHHPTVIMDEPLYTLTTPIQLWSGLRLQGGEGDADVKEYSTGVRVKWNGPADSSLFVFTGTQNGQSYPSGGSPRDVHITNIQFEGTSTTDWIQRFDPDTWETNHVGHELWVSTIKGCSWKGFRTIYWGWIDAVTFAGPSHVQGVYDTPFAFGGSENSFFDSGGYSFIDSNPNATPFYSLGKPFIRSALSMSKVGGQLMITARRNSYSMLIDGGYNTVDSGVAFDAQESDPVYGSQLRINGWVRNITVADNSFNNAMSAPGSALGNNRGWIDVGDADNVTFEGNMFRKGSASTSTPLLYASTSVEKLRWGMNTVGDFGATSPTVQQASSGRIGLDDPFTTVVTAP